MRFASLLALSLAACGGSGVSLDMTVVPDLTLPPQPDLQSRLDLAVPPTGNNVVPMIVDGFGAIDAPYVSLTICIPGTTTCTIVDHITVDTGSTGTRILAEVLPTDFLAAFPRPTQATGECYTYGQGYTFGSVLQADLTLGGETAPSTSFELIGDPALTTPAACQTTGPSNQTVATFGSNGIIGVGHFSNDCGSDCANPNRLGETNPIYYDCSNPTSCKPQVQADEDQVPNPVAKMPVDNNGVILELPALPEGSLPVANGYLLLGIGTEDNNALGDADVYELNSSLTGWLLNADYKGESFIDGATFDSGTSILLFPDETLSPCGDGLDCPTSPVQLEAAIVDAAQKSHTIHFHVSNGDAIYASGNAAADGLAETDFAYQQGDPFIVGLPFFFGRRMYAAIAGQHNPLGTAPFFAVY